MPRLSRSAGVDGKEMVRPGDAGHVVAILIAFSVSASVSVSVTQMPGYVWRKSFAFQVRSCSRRPYVEGIGDYSRPRASNRPENRGRENSGRDSAASLILGQTDSPKFPKIPATSFNARRRSDGGRVGKCNSKSRDGQNTLLRAAFWQSDE